MKLGKSDMYEVRRRAAAAQLYYSCSINLDPPVYPLPWGPCLSRPTRPRGIDRHYLRAKDASEWIMHFYILKLKVQEHRAGKKKDSMTIMLFSSLRVTREERGNKPYHSGGYLCGHHRQWPLWYRCSVPATTGFFIPKMSLSLQAVRVVMWSAVRSELQETRHASGEGEYVT